MQLAYSTSDAPFPSPSSTETPLDGSLDGQALLFGANPTSHVVAVEAENDCARLFRRTESGLVIETLPFTPWLLAAEPQSLSGATWTKLEGEGRSHLATFTNRADVLSARRHLRAMNAPAFGYGSMEKQFLVQSGVTLFKGMLYDDVHRLQLDLETEGLNPQPEGNRILLVALRDNRGWETILQGDERTLIEGLEAALHERDPDVIEGHNLFGFDLSYLSSRARRHGIPLRWGRDHSELQFLPERTCSIGGITRPFIPAHAYGRHFLDSLFASQRFDWARGEWERYGLKEVAKALGVAEEDRIRVDRAEMLAELQANPERVSEYALQDVRETGRVMSIVGATDFYVTQMVPETYERAAVGGTGEKVESLMAREYLRRGAALPLTQSGRGIPGGYTECRLTGVLSPVVKVDVESLYPSLMLTRQLAPKADRLEIFLPMLRELTARRLDAKARVRTSPPKERSYWDGLQGSFKILINSFYGYLCAGSFSFNDYDAAEAITRGGQEIVQKIAAEIEKRGGRVIEIDTDGVYFQPPVGEQTEEAEQAMVKAVADTLPQGIRLAYEGRYAAMVSLKMKNYALVSDEGVVTYRGSALRSRSDERFGRDFIAASIDRLVAGDKEGVAELYRDTLRRIMSGEMKPSEFVRRERITSNTYGETLRDRWKGLLPHVKIGDYVLVYRKAGGQLESIEKYAGDEDRAALAEKLYKFATRLKPALGGEFDLLFPKPKGTKPGEQVSLQMGFDF